MPAEKYPFHAKVRELQKISQVLADAFAVTPVNAQALWRERDAMQAEADGPTAWARQTLLARPEFAELAYAEGLRARGAATLADCFENGPGAFKIRDQRALLEATLAIPSSAKPGSPSGGGSPAPASP